LPWCALVGKCFNICSEFPNIIFLNLTITNFDEILYEK
jgi:hypothetical protein